MDKKTIEKETIISYNTARQYLYELYKRRYRYELHANGTLPPAMMKICFDPL